MATIFDASIMVEPEVNFLSADIDNNHFIVVLTNKNCARNWSIEMISAKYLFNSIHLTLSDVNDFQNIW